MVPDAADPPRHGTANFELAAIGDFRVGYAGHLYPGKGAEIILQLAERLPHVGFHVLGGYEEDVAVCRSRARGLFNIVFYGFRPQREVSSFLTPARCSRSAILAACERPRRSQRCRLVDVSVEVIRIHGAWTCRS